MRSELCHQTEKAMIAESRHVDTPLSSLLNRPRDECRI